jgi:hemerythrin superfamily protein
MDALILLKSDHEQVETIFKQLKNGVNLQQARYLFDELHDALNLHAKIEEQVFYPACAQYAGLVNLVKDGYQEHAQVKTLLSELSALEPGNDTWQRLMAQLIRNVQHHVKEEENQLFAEVSQLMGQKEREELGNRLEQAKESNRKVSYTESVNRMEFEGGPQIQQTSLD